MKRIALIFMATISTIEIAISQQNKNKFEGIWEFIPAKGSMDTSFKSYQIFKNNKIINIFYWTNTKSISIYGNPFTYYGFWDTYLEEPQPKKLLDLKLTGKYAFFYDDLIKSETKSKIGYDSLGNLYKPTRKCQWIINDELPKNLPPSTLKLYFNMEPDCYKKIDAIPEYLLNIIERKKEIWNTYLDFIK